jgi:hypothetical protein
MNDQLAKPMPGPQAHAPVSLLNRTGRGIRTVLVCSCEAVPPAAPESSRTMTAWHEAHRAAKRMSPLPDYSGVVFGEGPWMGLTWNEWYARHGSKGLDPYTGQKRTF